MIRELQLRLLPEEAANEQALKRVVARETGNAVSQIRAVRVLKRSIDARQRVIFVNVKLRPPARHLCQCQTPCFY